MGLITIIIILDSPGSAIFKQRRVGKHKKTFTMYKFRTMRLGSEKLQNKYKDLNEADLPVFKIKNDPRFTKFGKILSKSGFDELPQLVNIIKGDMAFVGPRPFPKSESDRIPKKYNLRFSVQPGIMSSWIINGAHDLTFKRWMELDLRDVKYKGIIYDLGIIFLSTITVVKIIFSTFKSLFSDAPQ
jgi:lipopolysaccharide/colanic/teichoic acid biosynthesis glycosyltransferase